MWVVSAWLDPAARHFQSHEGLGFIWYQMPAFDHNTSWLAWDERLSNMKTIMIIGCGGSGKSTLALKLGEILSIPVYHLDRLFWQRGWQSRPREEFIARQIEILNQPRWILDGHFGGTLDLRLKAADTVIFLDYPTFVCLSGAIARYWRFRNRSRPDMTDGNEDRLNHEYVSWILSYRRTRRPALLKKLQQISKSKNVIRLASRRQAQELVEALVTTEETAYAENRTTSL